MLAVIIPPPALLENLGKICNSVGSQDKRASVNDQMRSRGINK